MTTEEFISTIFFQINSELNRGASFRSLHICRLQNVIAVRGISHSGKDHRIIHKFTKREITHGLSEEQWRKLIKKIDSAFIKFSNNSKREKTRFIEYKRNKPYIESDLKKFFASEQKKTDAVDRDENIVNNQWMLV